MKNILEKIQQMKIIDSTINSFEQILEVFSDIHIGDELLIQCKSVSEWHDLGDRIKLAYPWTNFRVTKSMDDLRPILKIRVTS